MLICYVVGGSHEGVNCMCSCRNCSGCGHSLENMLSNKISVLYKDEGTVVEHVCDVLDIALIASKKDSFDYGLILDKLKSNGVNIILKSTFEKILYSSDSTLYLSLIKLLRDGSQASCNNVNLSVKQVFEEVAMFLGELRVYESTVQ